MSINLSDLDFNHRFVLLLDVNGFSELSDELQVEILNVLNKESKRYLKEGGWQRDRMLSTFVPVGDGFYILADVVSSLFWGSTYAILALSLRNALLKKFKDLEKPFRGVKIAMHFGRTLSFMDITDRENYVGAGMNECARLLSPSNSAEVAQLSDQFYSHQNYVVISRAALDKIVKLPEPVRMSEEFTILAKHNRTFVCRFIDMPGESSYILVG